MQATDWFTMLNKLTEDEQGGLVFGLDNRAEVSVELFIRLDPNYLLCRGRMGGTTDAGRVICIGYERITYMMFVRPVGYERMQEIYGEIRAFEKKSVLDQPVVEDTIFIDPKELASDTPAPKKKGPAAPVAADPPKPAPTWRERLRDRLAAREEQLKAQAAAK